MFAALKREIEAQSSDEFVRDQISLDRVTVYAAVQQIADSWRNPPGGVDDVLDRLERNVAPCAGSAPRNSLCADAGPAMSSTPAGQGHDSEESAKQRHVLVLPTLRGRISFWSVRAVPAVPYGGQRHALVHREPVTPYGDALWSRVGGVFVVAVAGGFELDGGVFDVEVSDQAVLDGVEHLRGVPVAEAVVVDDDVGGEHG